MEKTSFLSHADLILEGLFLGDGSAASYFPEEMQNHQIKYVVTVAKNFPASYPHVRYSFQGLSEFF
jgi:hypothetical protein